MNQQKNQFNLIINEKNIRIRELECQLQEIKIKLKEKELLIHEIKKPKLDPSNCPIFKPLVQTLGQTQDLKEKNDMY